MAMQNHNTTSEALYLQFYDVSRKSQLLTYSVMQSDGNSFYVDVVLDSFNMV